MPVEVLFFVELIKEGFFSSKFLFWMKWNLYYKYNDYDDSYQKF